MANFHINSKKKMQHNVDGTVFEPFKNGVRHLYDKATKSSNLYADTKANVKGVFKKAEMNKVRKHIAS